MKRHINIPVFIPHLGCPNQCVFCNQKTISGVSDFDPDTLDSIIQEALSTVSADTESEIASIAKFASTLKGVDEINLLPYHSFGRDKYVGLGREYPMGDIPSPTDAHMNKLKDVVERYGLKCNIGG